MTDFTPLQSLIGGALIGLPAVLLMSLHGRIAGMTGILSGVVPPLAPDWPWRAAFLAGAIVAPLPFLLAGGAGGRLREPAGEKVGTDQVAGAQDDGALAQIL